MTATSPREDLWRGIGLLEAAVQCVAGCGCWEPDGPSAPPWYARARIENARSRHDLDWARETLAALDRVLSWSDDVASAEGIFLGEMIHATGPRRGPVDPRAFFRPARDELARQLGRA